MRRVPQGKVPESPFQWTSGVAARETLRYLDTNKIDADPLLSKAGLTRGQLSQEGGGGSVASEYRFLELAAAETNDSLLGVHLAAEMDLRRSGILFYLAAFSRTVLEALENLARYVGTTTQAALLEISRYKDETIIIVRPARAHKEPRRQFSEFTALALIRTLRMQTNRDFAPLRLTFQHSRNSGLEEIHRILRCPIEFVHPTDSWVLPNSVIELPMVSVDTHLLQILTAHAEDLLAERRSATGLRSMVEGQLLSLLPSGRVQSAVVAQQLGMSARSFTRHLAQEGTSFNEILDRLRNRLALRFLADERISLQQIAWLLGYSELTAFNHAFKRWFGISPGKARIQQSGLIPSKVSVPLSHRDFAADVIEKRRLNRLKSG